MTHYADHRVEAILTQLRWTQRRQQRIIDSVVSHFGRQKVLGLIQSIKMRAIDLTENPDLMLIMEDKSPEQFIRQLALEVECDEAAVIESLRKNASPYPAHVEEQIIFGARHAGQDAARTLLHRELSRKFTIVELFQAIESLCYQGLPEDKNYFVSLRPLGHISVHFQRCAHTAAWKQAGADPAFLEKIQATWIKGIIDILSPRTVFERRQSIANGDRFGLDLYIPKNKYVSPQILEAGV